MFPKQSQLNQNPFQKTSTTSVDKSLSGLGGSIKSAISSFFKPKTPTGGGSLVSTTPTTSKNYFSPTGGTTRTTPVQNGKSMISSTTPSGQSIPAIQNQVLSSPVTVSGLSTPFPTFSVVPPPPAVTLGTSPIDTNMTSTTTPTKGGREDVLSRILALSDKQGTQPDRTLALEKEFDLQSKQETLNALNAKALNVERDYENKRRAIMENPEGKLTGALNGEIRNLDRARDTQLADIGIQQAVAQGNVELVNANIKRRVDAEFEPIKTQIEGLKSYLSLYDNDLTESEKAILDAEIRRQEFDYESGVENAQASQGAGAWQQLLDSGQVTLKDIPQAIVPYLNTATVKKYTDEQVAPIREKLTLLGDLVKGVDNSGAVGTNPLARTSLSSWVTGARQNFVAGVKQLTSQETLNALLELKAGGGTLGALSDGERFMLQESATKIGGWEMKDSNGNGTGFYNASEKSFKEELVKLQTLAEKAMLKADVVPLEEKAKIIGNKINRDNPSWSEEAKREALRVQLEKYAPQTSFNSVGNTTVSIPQQSRLAFVNNNPSNLRFAGQTGAVKGEGGFAKFQSPQAGVNALYNQIKLDASRGLTLAQFINKFAPPTENDTATYIRQVQQMTGASSSQKISEIDINLLAKAIAKKESSTNIA